MPQETRTWWEGRGTRKCFEPQKNWSNRARGEWIIHFTAAITDGEKKPPKRIPKTCRGQIPWKDAMKTALTVRANLDLQRPETEVRLRCRRKHKRRSKQNTQYKRETERAASKRARTERTYCNRGVENPGAKSDVSKCQSASEDFTWNGLATCSYFDPWLLAPDERQREIQRT